MRTNKLSMLAAVVAVMVGFSNCEKSQSLEDNNFAMDEGNYSVTSGPRNAFGISGVSVSKGAANQSLIKLETAGRVFINDIQMDLETPVFYLKNEGNVTTLYMNEDNVEAGLTFTHRDNRSMTFYMDKTVFGENQLADIKKNSIAERLHTQLSAVASVLFSDKANSLIKTHDPIDNSGHTARMAECFYYITDIGFTARGADINAGNALGAWLDNHIYWGCDKVSYEQTTMFGGYVYRTTYTVECSNCS